MGVSSAIFESASKRTEHYVPGVYTRSHNITSPSGVSAGNLCVMGSSNGGKPFTLMEFSSLTEAKDKLVSGELLNAIGYAFNGSNEYIPQKVFAMRVNEGTQSSITLNNGSTPLLKLKSWDYGSHTNQLKVWIKTGSVEKSTRFVFTYKNTTIESDDIVKKSLLIEYSGDGTASVAVNEKSIVLSDTDGDPITMNFVDYDTIGSIVAKINDSDNFVASIPNGEDDALSCELDTVTNTNIVGEGITLYSNYAAFLHELKKCDFIDAESIEELSPSTRVVPSETGGYLYFAGGENGGQGSGSEWTKALNVLATEDIQIIATPTTEDSVLRMIANHCKEMSSTVNRKERTCILGGEVGESDSVAIEKAVGFNSKYVSYVTDCGTAVNAVTGKVETISGAMLGVMLAGMEAAMAVNEPLTNKSVNILSFNKVRSIPNMESLIKKGVLVCNPNPDSMTSLVVIRALTTYQGDGDLISCERSMTREDLFMNRDLRKKFSSGIGHPNKADVPTIVQTLKDAAKDWATSGMIIPSDSNENVWNIGVKIDGDKIYLRYSRYLTAPLNFIFATATNAVYTSTVEV